VRLALLPSSYAPAVGGVEELTARLAQHLIALGDDVEVWTVRHPSDLPVDEWIENVRVRRFRLPLPSANVPGFVRSARGARAARRDLMRQAEGFRPDVLHVQCFSANGVYASWLARRGRIPLVVSLQGETFMDEHDIYDRAFILRASLRLGLRRADAVTGCSRYVLEDAERRFGLPPGRGLVIPNGVEASEPSETAIQLPFERFVLGAGRMVEKKGFDLLLDAFAHIAERHPEVGLVLGGKGRARSGLVEQAAALGLGDRVAFPGLLSRAEIAWAMEHTEVFVLPSRVEPFGIVVLEALRAGCPVVVSSRGGATEIVRDGVDGLVADPLDLSQLAAAIDRLLCNRILADKLGQAGASRARDFDWIEISDRYRRLYEVVRGQARR
jgi:glycogen(starch) synthase